MQSFSSIKIMKIESDNLIFLSDSYEQANTAASSQYANISTIHLMTVSIENNAITLENSATSLENGAISLENSTMSLKNSAISLENNVISLENSAISLENNAVHYITTVTVV